MKYSITKLSQKQIKNIYGGTTCRCVLDFFTGPGTDNVARTCNVPASIKLTEYQPGLYTDIQVLWVGTINSRSGCKQQCCYTFSSTRWIYGDLPGNYCQS